MNSFSPMCVVVPHCTPYKTFQALAEAHRVHRKPMAEICMDAIRDYLKKKLPKDQVKKFGL